MPKDALQLDFVFSNVLGGDGIYDNRGGFDYHLPIEGGIGTMPGKLHVCHIAVEMAPIAKVRKVFLCAFYYLWTKQSIKKGTGDSGPSLRGDISFNSPAVGCCRPVSQCY